MVAVPRVALGGAAEPAGATGVEATGAPDAVVAELSAPAGASVAFASVAFTSKSELLSSVAAFAYAGRSAKAAAKTARKCNLFDEVVFFVTVLFQTRGPHSRAPPVKG